MSQQKLFRCRRHYEGPSEVGCCMLVLKYRRHSKALTFTSTQAIIASNATHRSVSLTARRRKYQAIRPHILRCMQVKDSFSKHDAYWVYGVSFYSQANTRSMGYGHFYFPKNLLVYILFQLGRSRIRMGKKSLPQKEIELMTTVPSEKRFSFYVSLSHTQYIYSERSERVNR